LDGLNDLPKLNGAFTEKMGITLEVKLADASLAQPADLLYYVEAGLGRIADIVIDKNIF
jgi:hypothetical protein